MGNTFDEHRPLRAGIWIRTAKPNSSGGLDIITRGTLTGLATRTDGTKVLVTAKHVMTNSPTQDPTGNEAMYQQMATYEQMTNTEKHRALAIDATKKIGTAVSGLSNDADATMCTLEDGVEASFKLHTHANASEGGGHEDKVIVKGTVYPIPRSEELNVQGTPLLILGANREMRATVTRVRQSYVMGSGDTAETVTNAFWFEVVLGDGPLHRGDSGAPCLVDMGNNEYKMCGILLASEDDGRVGLAFKASAAEAAMGIKFGKRAPLANAGYDHLVGPGNTVTLDGSGTTDPDGDTLTYLWEQVPDVQHTVALSSATAVSPTFTAPSTAATVSFRLTVTNSYGMTGTDIVSVTVRAGAESLGGLAHGQTYNRTGSWSSKVPSVNRSGRYAKFYGFSLSRRAKVQIDLSSSVDPYLYMLSGAGTSGSVLAYNNDVGVSGNSRIIQTLDAGAYTLEATTYAARQVGSCTLAVQVYSNDATLSGLSLSAASASLTPAFASDEESYTASVGNSISSVRVTPTVNEANATVTVKGTTVASGQQSGPINLSVGKNTITVVVTAEDGTTKTYTVDVTRAAAPAPTPTPPPSKEIWGSWTDTGNTMSIGGGHWVKEQQRTSSLGNTETQWVSL